MNLMVTQGAEGLPRRAFTVEDAFRMVETGIIQEGERVELIEGEFVPMNAKNRIHQRVQDDVTLALARMLPAGLRIGIEPSLQLSETTFLSPDVVIYRDFPGERLTPADIMLAIEISDSSLAFDLGRKAELMATYQVSEYWVIDARRGRTSIHRNPVSGRYAGFEVLEQNALLKATHPDLAAVTFRLADLA